MVATHIERIQILFMPVNTGNHLKHYRGFCTICYLSTTYLQYGSLLFLKEIYKKLLLNDR